MYGFPKCAKTSNLYNSICFKTSDTPIATVLSTSTCGLEVLLSNFKRILPHATFSSAGLPVLQPTSPAINPTSSRGSSF